MRDIDFTRHGLFLNSKSKKEKKVAAATVRSEARVVLATTAQDRWANYTGRHRFYAAAGDRVSKILQDITTLSREALERLASIPITQEFRPVDGHISNAESLELLEEAYMYDNISFHERSKLNRRVNKRKNVVLLAVLMNHHADNDTKCLAEIIAKPASIGRSHRCANCGRAMINPTASWCPSCRHKTLGLFGSTVNIVTEICRKYGKAGKYVKKSVPNLFREEVKEGRTFTPDTFDDMEVGLITLVPTERHISNYSL